MHPKDPGKDKPKPHSRTRSASITSAADAMRKMTLDDVKKGAMKAGNAAASAGAAFKEGAKGAGAKAGAALTAAHQVYKTRRRGSSAAAAPAESGVPQYTLGKDMSEKELAMATMIARAAIIDAAIKQINDVIVRYNSSDRFLLADVSDFIDQFHLKDSVPAKYTTAMNDTEIAIIKDLYEILDLEDKKLLKQLAVKIISERYFRDHPDERVVEQYAPEPEPYNPFTETKSLAEFDRASRRVSMRGLTHDDVAFGEARFSVRTDAKLKDQMERDLAGWGQTQADADDESAAFDAWLSSSAAVVPSPRKHEGQPRSASDKPHPKSPRRSGGRPTSSGGKSS